MATVKLDPAKGIQIPNLTTTERNAISSPETGAIIWNTTTSEINQYNGSAWEITYTDTNTQIAGITSSADATAMTINATENVGVGVVPEAWNPVYDAIQVGNTTSIAGYSGGDIDRAWVTANGYVNTADGSWQYINTDTASQHEQRDGTHKFQVAPSGSADGTISWTTGFEVLNDGKARAKNGLLFGTDTAAANTLDDYEEGTFTITISGSSSGSGTVTGNAYYTKIGRLCTVSVNFNNQTVPTISGTVQIGLPFAAGNQGEYHGGDIYFYPLSAWTMGSNFVGHTPNIGGVGSTHIFMNKNVNTNRQGAFSTADNGSFSGSGGIYCRYSFTYVTAT